MKQGLSGVKTAKQPRGETHVAPTRRAARHVKVASEYLLTTVRSLVLERTLLIITMIWKLSLIAMMSYGISLLSSLRETVVATMSTVRSIFAAPPPKAIRSEPLVLPALDEPYSDPSEWDVGPKVPK